jgi:haloalkane dehalogenase
MGLGITLVLLTLIIIANLLNFVKQILVPVYQVLAGSRAPSVLRTPEERFSSLHLVGYNFKPNYIEFNAGCGIKLPRVHYLDEGPRHGRVILCLHGEPTWSYLYRKMIPPLVEAGYRVVVPDFIGFGKSDKYTSARNYTHEMHTMTLRLLIEELNLQDIVLVCQDWGGLTGLSVVKDCPGLFSCLVLMNTGLPDPALNFDSHGFSLQLVQQGLPFVLWRAIVGLLGTGIPLDIVFKLGFRKQAGVNQEVINGYTAPFPTSLYCGGVASWPLLVPFYKNDPVTCHMWEAKNCLKTWKKPVLLAFSDSDPITKGQEKMFLSLVPSAKNVVIKGAKHFLQETHGVEISNEILKFLSTEKMTSL